MDKLVQTYLRFHYPFQDIIGRIFAWGVLSLVIITSLVVILRYGFETGSIALQETITYNHAILFMLGISYTYLHDEHVRVDVFYSRYSPQRKQWVNLLGSILFTLPITLFILWSSWDYVSASWAISESSPEGGGLGYVYLLKTLILVMASLLLLQAIAVIGKSWLQLKSSASDGSEEQKLQGGKL
ncbi:TRAP transporter small permease subunit [Thiomicrorhabdus xiamenensis]|uniref:TRAP transporter small permease protein n=1 Tax=Thiomicrorhabdus xiamenensis TaxID=2739063 RepID=A0A7D4T920_9GAMM|nr:TRAP transporter small permease subunit [Thiomicrorhabdus xiamenensis]QKI88226.1 TRAP transporter small permease subunit [Thiomicrorhabdus xiamenensis]